MPEDRKSRLAIAMLMTSVGNIAIKLQERMTLNFGANSCYRTARKCDKTYGLFGTNYENWDLGALGLVTWLSCVNAIAALS